MTNTLKFAFRFLYRQKAFSIINILGLALSLACCIILSRYLYRVYNIDSHAIDINSIMVINRTSDINNSIINKNVLLDIYNKELEKDLDNQILETCKIIPYEDCQIQINQQSRYLNALIADSTILDFFDYKIIGDKNAMYRQDGCWVSQQIIQTLGYTSDEIIGKTIVVENTSFIISGIFETPNCETIINPDIIVSFFGKDYWEKMDFELLRTKKNFNIKSFNNRLLTYQTKRIEDTYYHWNDKFISCQLISWKDFYYFEKEELRTKIINHGNKTLNWILVIVQMIILIIGMINFINLYLVYWQRRQSEEGVRRVFGQKAPQLFIELWTELEILVFASVFLAWIFVEISTPCLNSILGYYVTITYFDLILTLLLIIILPLLAIIYPFIQQIKRSPIVSLQHSSGSIQNSKSRTIILGFQFIITFALLTITLWMQNHLNFLLNSQPGFKIENILLAKPLQVKPVLVSGKSIDDEDEAPSQSSADDVIQKSEVIINRLKESSSIKSVIISESTPISNFWQKNYFNDKNEKIQLFTKIINNEWFDIFEIPITKGKLTSGKPLINKYVVDQWVVNEKVLNLLGYNDIKDGLLRSESPLMINWDGINNKIVEYGKEPMAIGGLVSDCYFKHRTFGKTPMVYEILDVKYTDNSSMLIIKTQPNQEKEAVEYLEKVCKEVCPEETLEYHWFKDDIKDLYKDDKLIANIYSIFSFIAILICCLGLLGISLFDINQRFREIAIRKANGAHRKDLLLLLGKKYFYILISTFVLSIPITYILIHHYTQSFIESAPLTPVIFIVAFVIVLIITTLTLLYQLKKATNVNVAEIIKCE
ncbi:MAG: ABC transporter permease [Bacteroidales bacterium]|nr:ABC transporter permease [Bacteroidales bacterium]